MRWKFSSYKADVVQSLQLAFPVMLSQLGHVLIGVTDSVMVGHIGATELAAAGLANVAFNILMLFGIGVSYAITPLVALADGAGDKTQSGEVLRHGLVVNVVNALILCVIVYFGKTFLYYIDQPADVVALAIPYLEVITFSLIPILIFQSFRQFSEGLSDTVTPMVIVWATVVVNAIMNYVLINGYLGFPPLGLNGAGWATLTSRIVMAVAIAVYIFSSRKYFEYRLAFRIGNYSRSLFRKLLALGLPAGSQFIFEVAAFDFSLVMMGWLGTTALAAHQIAVNLATISYMTASGVAAAATIRVSHELGKQNPAGVRRVAFVLVGIGLALMTTWAALFVAGHQVLPLLYINDDMVIPVASSLLLVAGLFQLSDGMQVICIGALRGLHDVRVPSLLIFISYWVIGLPLGYWLGLHTTLGPVGIWMGLLIGLTLTAGASFFRLKWLVQKALPAPTPVTSAFGSLH
jgi:MATE family multidrug resistance protein